MKFIFTIYKRRQIFFIASVIALLTLEPQILLAQYTLSTSDVEFDAETGTIIKYKWPEGAGTSIIIPDKFNGTFITTLGAACFININYPSEPGSGLTDVVIPNSVKEIKQSAFQFNKINNLSLGNGVTTIGKEAFSGNNISGKLQLPNSLRTIKDGAFAGNKISEIIFPQELKEIDTAVFYGNKISILNLPETIQKIHVDAFAFNNISKLTIPHCISSLGGFRGNNISQLTIPSHVKTIGAYAFLQNPLTHLTIENGVEFIGNGAFSAGEPAIPLIKGVRSDLKNSTVSLQGTLNIPKSVKYIGEEAFRGNNGLDALILNEGLEKIDYQAFAFCNLEELKLPSTIKIIGAGAFQVNNISLLTFPKNLEKIGGSAFAQNNLQNITIPSKVKELGEKAFYGNSAMQSITLEEGVQKIGIECFAYNQNINELNLPTTLIHIGKGAFFNTFFESVSLPNSVNNETTAPFLYWVYYDDTPDNFDKSNKVESIGGSNNTSLSRKGYLALFGSTPTKIRKSFTTDLKYTNPVTDVFTINKHADIAIYTIEGTFVKGTSVSANQALDLSFLQSGVYLFVFDLGTKKVTKKIIKR
jgi:hypothetical protein